MPTLQQFRYLVAVADTLHFRRAAESVNVTQPTLSTQLKELETRLGAQLVERSRSGVTLTPVGHAVADRARGILRDVADIAALARSGADPLAATMRVGIVGSLGGYFLPLVIPALHARYPALKFYVREGLAADLMKRLRDGTLDVIFFPLPLEDPVLQVTPLFHEPLLVVLPSDHVLAGEQVVDRAALAGETVMSLEAGHRLHDRVADLCEETGAILSLDYEGDVPRYPASDGCDRARPVDPARALHPFGGGAREPGRRPPALRSRPRTRYRDGLAPHRRPKRGLSRTGRCDPGYLAQGSAGR